MSNLQINIIVAYSKNRVIGKDNKLLWRLADDMAFFKKMTTGKTVLMGRKTYESLPAKFRPLPNRLNLVISRDITLEGKDNLEYFTSIENALYFCKKTEVKELFIIGGGQIYKEFIEKANCIYATELEVEIDGDTYFPKIDNSWKSETIEVHSKNEKNDYDFKILKYYK